VKSIDEANYRYEKELIIDHISSLLFDHLVPLFLNCNHYTWVHELLLSWSWSPLVVECVLFEVLLKLVAYPKLNDEFALWRYVVCALCVLTRNQQPLSRGVLYVSGFSGPQRPTPSATAWPL